jgi:hypothetical protein
MYVPKYYVCMHYYCLKHLPGKQGGVGSIPAEAWNIVPLLIIREFDLDKGASRSRVRSFSFSLSLTIIPSIFPRSSCVLLSLFLSPSPFLSLLLSLSLSVCLPLPLPFSLSLFSLSPSLLRSYWDTL